MRGLGVRVQEALSGGTKGSNIYDDKLRTVCSSNVQRFRGGLVFKAHRLLYHLTLGLREIKKKRRTRLRSFSSSSPPSWSSYYL